MPEMTAYRTECCKRCEWCAKGIPRAGFALQFHDTSAGNVSAWPRCTAPTLAQFSEEQAAELEEAKSAIRGLLVMMDRGDCPQKLYAALTWVENDELARKNAELVLNKPVIVPDSEVRKNA